MSLLQALGLPPPKPRVSAAPSAIAAATAKTFGERKFESERTRIKAALVDSPLARAAQGDVSSRLTLRAGAERQIAGLPAALFAGKGEADFDKMRTDVQKIVDALDTHARKVAIQTAIVDARAKLTLADTDAARKDYAAGLKRVMEAQLMSVHAKKLANDVSEFLVVRGSVVAQVYAFDRLLDAKAIGDFNTAVNRADTLAQGPPPDVPAAKATLLQAKADIGSVIKAILDAEKARLVAIDAMDAPAKAAVATDLAQGRRLIASGEAAYASEQWSACLIAAIGARDFLAPSLRMAGRRGSFDTQRAATVALIATLKGTDAIKSHAAELDASVAEADKLGDPKALQFEKGERKLKATAERCTLWIALAPSIAAVNTTVAAATNDLAALDVGPAARATTALRDPARARLAQAAELLLHADDGDDPAHNVQLALTAARRAGEDVAQAKALAAGLFAVQGAEVAAANPTDITALHKALDALRADLAAARAAKPPAAAETEFKKADAAVTDCDAALAQKDGKPAATALRKAAQALAAGRGSMVEQAQFDTLAAALDARRSALDALPNAAKLKPRLDDLEKALAEARRLSGAPAITALRRGEEIASAAEHADAERNAFDSEAAVVDGMVAAIADAKAQADVGRIVGAAKAHADALRFADAMKALGDARRRAGIARVKALVAANPPDERQIADVAADLASHLGASTVDVMLQALPAGTDPRAAVAMAKGRFGVEFTTDGKAPPADELKAVKAISKMLAKAPKDSANNPSLKAVTYADAPAPGGLYDQATATMSMTGRVGAEAQQFGSRLKMAAGPAPAPGVPPPMVNQLPANIDSKCRPLSDEPVDVIDWASLHEVGHGLDDKHAYMLRNQSRPDHGGWTSYASDVKKIADVVGPHFGFYQTAEQRKYVLDMLMSMPAVDPPAPDARTDWVERKAGFDRWHRLATSENVFRREPDCVAITIGKLIFHEAYPRQWVSYLAAARKQGLTGFQFKAPGEWFSELYAGYKSGKLGSKHPARAWLETLSP